jgi:hypothetical protein
VTAAADPLGITVTFPADGDGPPVVQVGESVTIGQLVLVAWVLDHMAEDARRGQLMAQAQLRGGLLVPVPGSNGGRRA